MTLCTYQPWLDSTFLSSIHARLSVKCYYESVESLFRQFCRTLRRLCRSLDLELPSWQVKPVIRIAVLDETILDNLATWEKLISFPFCSGFYTNSELKCFIVLWDSSLCSEWQNRVLSFGRSVGDWRILVWLMIHLNTETVLDSIKRLCFGGNSEQDRNDTVGGSIWTY